MTPHAVSFQSRLIGITGRRLNGDQSVGIDPFLLRALDPLHQDLVAANLAYFLDNALLAGEKMLDPIARLKLIVLGHALGHSFRGPSTWYKIA